MKAIIDTSSLVALVKTYMPFDENDNLKKELEKYFKGYELIIIDKVFQEARNIKGGEVFRMLDFIEIPKGSAKPKLPVVDTSNILPSRDFILGAGNDFCNQLIKSKLTSAQFEQQKDEFLADTDASMMIYSQHLITTSNSPYSLLFPEASPEKVILVTEESPYNNDNKLYKKIPVICKMAGINTCTLAEYFKHHLNLSLGKLLS